MYIKKEIEKRIYNFLWNNKKKSDFPDTQLNSLKIKLIQKLLNPTNALWKDLMLH